MERTSIRPGGPPPSWKFDIFVVGNTARSAEAIADLGRVLDRYLPGQYVLDVIDLKKHPELAAAEQIIVTPLVVRRAPLPVRKLAGNFANDSAVASALGLADGPGAG